MATIKDVARAAGVSASTVSHVINGTRHVATETRERVTAAIASLAYHPWGAARALRGDRTYLIGMLVATTTNPFFAEVIRGVEESCFSRRFSLLLCNTGDVLERLLAYLRTLMMQRIDGLVVLTTNMSAAFFPQLEALRSVPVVAIDTEETAPAIAVVKDDSFRGGQLAGRHLTAAGFQRLGVITGPVEHPRSQERLAGFTAALAETGITLDPHLVVAADLTARGGHRAMARLLEAAGKTPPEAVFCLNDLTALGGLSAIAERGLSVPDDVSLVGYDDIELTEFSTPPLTTIRQPAFQIGAKAAEVLVDFIETGTLPQRRYTLEPELVARRSVRPTARAGRAPMEEGRRLR